MDSTRCTVFPIVLAFVVACASGPFSARRYGAVTDKESFAREACGPYFKATSLASNPPVDVAPVLDAISLRVGSVRECYMRALTRKRDLQGCVAVRFTVDREQRVNALSSVWNSTGSAQVADCVVGALDGIGVIQGARSSEYAQAFVFAIEH
jgi:hypothetical protein